MRMVRELVNGGRGEGQPRINVECEGLSAHVFEGAHVRDEEEEEEGEDEDEGVEVHGVDVGGEEEIQECRFQ